MVEDRVTDGKRIAQLLSSELSGRDRGILGDVSVVDADPDAEPTPDGAAAYGVAYRDERIATVRIYPDAAELELADASGSEPPDAAESDLVNAVATAARDAGLTVTDDDRVRVESGAAVKRAVDALVAGLSGDE